MLIMLDISSSGPTHARWLLIRFRMIFHHILERGAGRAVGCEEFLLQYIGKPGHPDTKKPNSSSGVDGGEQGGGNRADDLRAIRRVEQRS